MHDPTRPSPSPLHSDMQQERNREAQRLAVCAGTGEEASGAAGRASRNFEGRDAGPKVARAIDSKVCTVCEERKDLDKFSKSKSAKDGLCGTCKECSNKRSAKWRAENRDQFLSLMREWYHKNKEKVLSANKLWAENNRDLMRKYGREWARRNKEYALASVHKRRAMKKKVGGNLSKGLAQKLYKLQRGKCACCGVSLGKEFHLDHIIPLVLGGPNVDSNIQLLSPTCNFKKNRKHPIDYMQSKGYLL